MLPLSHRCFVLTLLTGITLVSLLKKTGKREISSSEDDDGQARPSLSRRVFKEQMHIAPRKDGGERKDGTRGRRHNGPQCITRSPARLYQQLSGGKLIGS